MDRENFEFLKELTKEQRSDLSKAVRDMVTRGRVLLAMERYKKGEASLGRAAELAGIPVGQMMTLLTEFGVQSRIEDEDYLQGLAAIRKAWCLLKVFDRCVFFVSFAVRHGSVSPTFSTFSEAVHAGLLIVKLL